MSKIALSGNASGTGTFTIASPNSNTDRTLNLPDNSGTLLSNASTAGFPAGSVLQVVQEVRTASVGTNSTTLIGSGQKVDITPSSVSSKVLVIFSGTGYIDGNSGQYWIYRNGSPLRRFQIGTGIVKFSPAAMVLLDAPNSTSSVRYEVYFSNSSSATFTFFPPGGDDSVMCIAMEIAA